MANPVVEETVAIRAAARVPQVGHFARGIMNGPDGPVELVYNKPRRAAWATAAARDETLSLLKMFAT